MLLVAHGSMFGPSTVSGSVSRQSSPSNRIGAHACRRGAGKARSSSREFRRPPLCRVWGLGFRDEGLGIREQGLGFRVQGLRF